jgi:hypothetical protein
MTRALLRSKRVRPPFEVLALGAFRRLLRDRDHCGDPREVLGLGAHGIEAARLVEFEQPKAHGRHGSERERATRSRKIRKAADEGTRRMPRYFVPSL